MLLAPIFRSLLELERILKERKRCLPFPWLDSSLGQRREQSAQVDFACSDMWGPYVDVIAERAPEAVHVLDRFHIMRLMNKAIDEVRRAEAKHTKGG